jgi:hypothetical protein
MYKVFLLFLSPGNNRVISKVINLFRSGLDRLIIKYLKSLSTQFKPKKRTNVGVALREKEVRT